MDGVGAILAIAWQVGGYFIFIRGGTKLATASTETLGDEVLCTAGAFVGALALGLAIRRAGPTGITA